MSAMDPARPGDLISVSPRELLDAWHGHASHLVDARCGIGVTRPVGRLRSDALDSLAIGEAIANRFLAFRWVTVVDALNYGADLDRVAVAMGLTVAEVVAGLHSWADRQLREQLMTPVQHDAVITLTGAAGDPR